jgi:hypothetical protein
MRYSEKFNPEWGYLAPAPGFLRTVRVVLAAIVVGAIAGVGVVFSLVAHPSSEDSIALRTLAKPGELSTDRRADGQAEVTPTSSQAASQMVATRSTPQSKSHPTLSARQLTDESAVSAHTNSTAKASGETASARLVALPGNSQSTVIPPVEATTMPAANIERVQKRAVKKSRFHYAWRETGRWGGEYYGDRGWRYRDTW